MDGAHTHGPGGAVVGAGVATGLLLAGGASVAAGKVTSALGELARLLLIGAGTVVVLALAAGTVLMCLARRRPPPQWQAPPLPAGSRELAETGRAVTAGPAVIEHHHHWAGVDPQTLALAFAHLRADDGPTGADEVPALAQVRADDA